MPHSYEVGEVFFLIIFARYAQQQSFQGRQGEGGN